MYPSLQRWAGSPDARQAVWHAAQMLRAARRFPRGCLKEFWGVAVCHGALVVWGFGVLGGVPRKIGSSMHGGGDGGGSGDGRGKGFGGMQGQRGGAQGRNQNQRGLEMGVVHLDEEDDRSGEVQAWVDYGRGRPAIQGLGLTDGADGPSAGHGARSEECCLIEDPRACMEVAQEILRANFVGVWESLPPLSENIIVVLKQLEKAAWAVGMG